ncbi:MAG: SDR family oxidoreductase [Collimonas sp.]|uniref:SDR family oxidoreductase n=1 Tax=Collimonas sp. TaxID=1963772 RepID=UPI0032662416
MIQLNAYFPLKNKVALVTGAALLGSESGRARFWQLDVSDSNAVQRVMAGVEGHFGRIDILVNSAGIDADNALRYASRNIRVNTIHPGFSRPPAVVEAMRNQGDLTQTLVDLAEVRMLAGRGSATDVAAGILYLVSDASRFVSGSELVIEAGYGCRS